MYENRVSEIRKALLEQENKVRELTNKITEAVGRAAEACERIETARDPKSIEREMTKLKQKVRERGPGWASFGMGRRDVVLSAVVEGGVCVLHP